MPVDLHRLQLGATYTRRQLAQDWGYDLPALGVGVFTPAGAKLIILFVTHERRSTDTPYDNFLSGGYLFWDGQEGHGTDARIVAAGSKDEAIHVFYRELHASAFEYRGQAVLVDYTPHTNSPSRFTFRLIHDLSAQDDLVRCEPELRDLPATVRESVTLARLGQGRFRLDLMNTWNGRCAVTDVHFPQTLRASHIKPWRLSTNSERLDHANGLLLLPQYDALFDRGFITFEDSGKVQLSPILAAFSLDRIGIRPDDRLRFVHDEHLPFLHFHRENIFKGALSG